MQEPFSVLFSAFNFLAHLAWFRRMQPRALPRALPLRLRKVYGLLPILGMNAWFWSAVFHTRDWPATEKMDYFSAAASVLVQSYLAFVRLFGLYRSSPQRGTAFYALAVSCVVLLAMHCTYLSFWRFDYGWNMKVNVGLGVVHNLLWFAWSAALHLRQAPTPPHALKAVWVLSMLSLATMLELLDFEPWQRCIDAHALWHLSTVPIIGWWYSFLWQDAQYLAEVERQGDGYANARRTEGIKGRR